MSLVDSLCASVSRRRFLRGAATAAGIAGVAPLLGASAASAAAAGAQRWWLGTGFWGNRTEDWTLVGGRISCVAAATKRGLCTVAVLTRELDGAPAQLGMTTGTSTAGPGFSGFMIGTGVPGEDHRRRALVHRASGTGGGILAVLGSDGVARFRDHTDEADQFAYAELPSTRSGQPKPRTVGESLSLTLDITPTTAGRVSLTLRGTDTGGALLTSAVLTDVAVARVAGGIGLVSSGSGKAGATYWFSGLLATGAGVIQHDERGLGPVMGTLFSLSGRVLKMTAQLAPFPPRPGDQVVLETQAEDGTWLRRAVSPVGAGFAAQLRVEDWDVSRAADYRVTASTGGRSWMGRVPAEPTPGTTMRIATISCSKASHRSTDSRTRLDGGLSGGAPLPLYSAENVYFPYDTALGALLKHQPDLLVAMGDQFYETSPTAKDTSSAPDMDFFYRYLQWLWAVRDITRNVPTLVLVDDHDVFQGNIWGEGGLPAAEGNQNLGGYVNSPDWVNLVQRVQCGHNPDPVDPEPVAQGITVYFTRFDYGGVTFALLEDRKFKTSPDGIPGVPVSDYQFLGPRQEAMLDSLSGATNPVVVITQTMFACVETDRDGVVMGTKDSGGWPKDGRDRALTSIKAAGGVLLSGDTHLAALVRHGIDDLVDGPIQFCGPAVSASYQRWFQPAAPLPDPTAEPFTGRAVDGLGNDYRVLAVANPRRTKAQVLADAGIPSVGQRHDKSEGYGLLVIDPTEREFRFAAWAWDADPDSPDALPLPGWPYTLPFDLV